MVLPPLLATVAGAAAPSCGPSWSLVTTPDASSGSPGFVAWRTGETLPSATFVPDAGTGSYSFRGTLRRTATGKAAGWSPAAILTVR